MFKKLISNLPFNPSLIAQVSFYAKRLRQESAIRRTGFVMLALTMIVQMLAVISPAQPSLAASGNDIIPGGITSQQNAVDVCNGNAEIQAIYGYFGVSCQAIANSEVVESVNTHDYNSQMYSLGRFPYGKEGEVPVQIGSGTYYMRYVWSWGDYNFKALRGTRSNGTPFLIMFDCGNIIIIGPPQQPQTPTPAPTPSPGPAAPTVTASCVNGASAIDISWVQVAGDQTVYNVNLYPDKGGTANTTVGQFYNKRVEGSSTTRAPDGFNRYDGTATPGPAFGSLNPGSRYYFNIHYPYPNLQSSFASIVAITCTSPNTPPPPPPRCPLDNSLLQSDARCQACQYNPSLIASDSACQPPPRCPLDSSLLQSDAKCTPCPYNATIIASNPSCTPPPPRCALDNSLLQSDSGCTPCPYNSSIIASNASCQPPKCPYDSSVAANNTACTACPYDTSIAKTNPSCERCPYTGLTNISKQDAACQPRCPYDNTIASTDARCPRCPYQGLTSLSKLDGACKQPCAYNNSISQDSPACKPCDKSQTQTDTTACIILSKTARNDTQNIANADGTTAHGGDVIVYTLSAQNTGKVTVNGFAVQENIGDALEYADIVDLHGGSWDKTTNIITWPKADITPNGTLVQQLTIKVKNPVPQTPVSTSNPGTGDLTMTNVYGNTVNIKLPATVVKTTEQVTRVLPNTGPGTSLIIGFSLTTVIAYFFARTKLFVAELDLVREEFAAAGGQ